MILRHMCLLITSKADLDSVLIWKFSTAEPTLVLMAAVKTTATAGAEEARMAKARAGEAEMATAGAEEATKCAFLTAHRRYSDRSRAQAAAR